MFNFNVNRDSRILNQVQEKLMTNNVIVTKARKDNSIIIIKEEEYGNKINPINAELNPICHLMVLLRAHPILYISRIRVNQFFLQIGLQELDADPTKNYQNLTYCL